MLSLGDVPLVNAFRDPADASPEPRYPLDVIRCTACTLLQLNETVEPEILFRQYAYFSSYSDSFLEHARSFADDAIREHGLGTDSRVIEAASNDGYLLQYFRDAGVGVLGIEPARNVASVARSRGVPTIEEFLDERLAESIVADHGHADLVVANNVLAHVPDVNGFVSGLRVLAGDEGVISIEVPYAKDLVDRVEFDTIYHEHVSYFSLTALQRLVEQHALVIRDATRLGVHGGSLRVTLASRANGKSVGGLLGDEAEWGVNEADRYAEFAEAVDRLRSRIHETVADLASRGSVAAYGAAAKGVVLANTCDLDRELVAFAADRNPHKQGKLFPGVGIPVVAPDELSRRRPDYCLLFAWNLAVEIRAQQRAYTDAGGRFLVPLPEPEVLAA